jgi:hypothetical protein
VIGPREFLEAAEPLLALRRSEGLRVKTASTEEIFSEFGFGEPRPEAIRDFLSYAYHQWRSPSVRYVLLLGDGTYDYKDYLKTGVVNQVPPLIVKTSYLWTASDPTYASVNGEDILPDLAIGRLPAATIEELRQIVEKILTYETGPVSFQELVALVADNPDKAGDFVGDAEELAATVLSSKELRKIYLSELGAAETRSEILQAFDEGASVMSYMGHGGIHLWADENIFGTSQVGSLVPQTQQPLLLTMNCLNGYFHFPYFDALSEALVIAEDRGAIAAFSPSGLSLNDAAHVYHQKVLEAFLQGDYERLGDVVLAAQEAYATTGALPELLSIYHLLGDPGMKLR